METRIEVALPSVERANAEPPAEGSLEVVWLASQIIRHDNQILIADVRIPELHYSTEFGPDPCCGMDGPELVNVLNDLVR